MINFIKKHIWIIIVVVLIILFPKSLSDQATLNMRVIIAGIGIDFVDDQYQITAQLVLPKNGTESGGISAELNFVTSQGQTISDGVQQISYKLGKIAELSHLEYIVIGPSMKNFNLASSLDYFFRNFKLKNSVMLLASTKDAQSAIKSTGALELGVALSLQKIYIANQSSLNAISQTYVDFINKTFNKSGTCVLDTLEISTPQQQSQEGQQSQQEGGGQSGQAGSNPDAPKGNIQTKSPIVLLKDGNWVGQIDDQAAILGYYFAGTTAKMGNIYVPNFTYGEAQNANINLRIDQMKQKNCITWQDNKPIHTININISEVRLDEIAPQQLPNIALLKNISKDMQDHILQAARDQIKSYVYKAIALAREQNFDIFQTANYANISSQSKWQKYISNLDPKTHYMQDVDIVVNVNFDKIT